MANLSIENLKKHLGPGLGLRKNKYLIEIPIPGIDGQSLNVLCRSAGMPERVLSTASVYKYGRKYNIRSEHDFPGTYEISIVDRSDMAIRKAFDKWFKKIDNTKPPSAGIFGASFENVLGEVNDALDAANSVKTALENDGGLGFFMGFLDAGNANSAAKYQTDVNIWQLDGNENKVYGYKLQNAFPSSIGIVTLDDGDENTLTEFSVTLTYSEFIPLETQGILESVTGGLLGDGAIDAIAGVENLFD